MEQLLDAYKRYWQTPRADSAKELAGAITDFGSQLPDEHLYSLWEKYQPSLRPTDFGMQFRSSGSLTGERHYYSFGPLQSFWLKFVEYQVKYPHGKGVVVGLTNRYPRKCAPYFFEANPGELHFNYFLGAGPFNTTFVDFAIRKFDELLDRWPQIHLLGTPQVFLYLHQRREFEDYLIAHRDRLTVVSTSWEAFFKKQTLLSRGVHVNDNMINWENGLNFYHCRHNSTHALPIFGARGTKVIPLLNLYRNQPLVADDLFRHSPGDGCACGKPSVDLAFMPHTERKAHAGNKYLYDLNLAEELHSAYQNLQFITVPGNDTVSVLYAAETMLDKELIVAWLFAHGRHNVKFIPGAKLEIAAKVPTFYHNVPQIPLTHNQPACL